MCLKTCLLQILTPFILTIGVQNTIDTFHSIILCEYGMCVFYKVTLTLLVCIVSFYTQPICRKNTPDLHISNLESQQLPKKHHFDCDYLIYFL